MTKADLINAIAEKADITKTKASEALNAMLSGITETLAEGEQVSLPGFGTFLLRRREARTGRNPQTGEIMQIKAANIPAFKAGKNLKDAVQEAEITA